MMSGAKVMRGARMNIEAKGRWVERMARIVPFRISRG